MKRLGILGVGKMGGSILEGIMENQKYFASEILFYTPNLDHQIKYRKLGLTLAHNEKELFQESEVILLAIKPQLFKEILTQAISIDFTNRCVISIAAGISIGFIADYFKNAVVVRAMPNTPTLIHQAMTTICTNQKNELYTAAKDIFRSIGSVEEIEEWQMDESVPLNGSMPAYLYLFAKSFIDQGIQAGIEPQVAKRLCCHAIIGSANLILSSEESIDTLIQNVCSKKGTTIEGLEELYKSGFPEAIEKCYTACVRRSKELSQ